MKELIGKEIRACISRFDEMYKNFAIKDAFIDERVVVLENGQKYFLWLGFDLSKDIIFDMYKNN
jgi:hypothetical protein